MSVVLEGSKEDDEKWKRFSRQIVDVVFPQLSKLQVRNVSILKALRFKYRDLISAVFIAWT